MSGPNIAGELARYRPATAVAAADDAALAQRVQAVSSTQWFRVYTNADVIGVELAGATKNVIAIAAGILDGMAAGNNAKAALVTRGLVEITRLGVAMGARNPPSRAWPAWATSSPPASAPKAATAPSANRSAKATRLKQVLDSMDSVAEGVPTTQSVMQLANQCHVEMPITAAVHAVLFEGKDVLHALSDLMSRDPKPERAAR